MTSRFSMKSALNIFFIAVILLLSYLPITILCIYSFNSSSSPMQWQGFSLRWYKALFYNDRLMDACLLSVVIAFSTALISVVLGMLMAIGTREIKSARIKSLTHAMAGVPLLIPEIVIAIGLLVMISKLFFTIPSGIAITLGHLTFGIPYVTFIVWARLEQCDRRVEEAAKNLGATRLYMFYKVLWPELRISALCAFLLAFTCSLDDFYLSHFLTFGGAGAQMTLPVYLFSLQSRSALTPEMNALGSLMLFFSTAILLVTAFLYFFKNDKLKRIGKWQESR